MLFNSYEFIFYFLPSVLVLFYFGGYLFGSAFAKVVLVFASLYFYMQWNAIYIVLLAGSIICNYVFNRLLLYAQANKARVLSKRVFIFALIFNIGLLAYFKYSYFIVENINLLVDGSFSFERVVLPLAISFFTLQQIAFQVDVYEGLVKEKNFLNYSLFVVFFPQLIAGPIVHHKEMMPQFSNTIHKPVISNINVGLFIFSLGLFKKVCLADFFAQYVDVAFPEAASLSVLEAWLGALAFTCQMYFDFSGYADMAVGLAWMFNIRLPFNFNSPYHASSVIQYWERWHITLSRFITTYVFTPLLRNTMGKLTFTKAMIATMLAMLISGLWHGAAWTFVVWGGVHGLALVVNHMARKRKMHIPHALAVLLTFTFVIFSMVIFRAENLQQAGNLFLAMLGMADNGLFAERWLSAMLPIPAGFEQSGTYLTAAALALSMLLWHAFPWNSNELYTRFRVSPAYVVLQVFLLAAPLAFMLEGGQEFIYFQF